MAVLGRLAVDRAQQGRGLGRALFRDCALRVAQAADLRILKIVNPKRVDAERRTFAALAREGR